MNVIETKRLILRTWKEEDIEHYYQMNQDPKVIEWLMGTLTVEEVKTFIVAMNAQYEKLGLTLFAVEEKVSGCFIGYVGLNQPQWQTHFTPCIEIGWRLDSHYWHRGYATEAAKAVLTYAFQQCGLDEVVAFTVPENVRSIRVMEKIGMTRHVKDDFVHPKLPLDHRLSRHILYRIKNPPYET